MTQAEAKRYFVQHFRHWWKETGADIKFSFVDDEMLSYYCANDYNCPSGYFCDTYFHKCAPNFDMSVRSFCTSTTCYSRFMAGDFNEYGCPTRLMIDNCSNCSYYNDPIGYYTMDYEATHEIGHMLGIRSHPKCYSEYGYCFYDYQCESILGPEYYCHLPDYNMPSGFGCCRIDNDDGSPSIMHGIGSNIHWHDISTIRYHYGQREQKVVTRHFFQGSWVDFDEPPLETNYGTAVAFDSEDEYYCVVAAIADTYNMLRSSYSTTAQTWYGSYPVGIKACSTHPPALYYFEETSPGENDGHFLLVYVKSRKYSTGHRLYYKTSTNCQSWSGWSSETAVPDSTYAEATSTTRPQIIQIDSNVAFMIAPHCELTNSEGKQTCYKSGTLYSEGRLLAYEYDIANKQFLSSGGLPMYTEGGSGDSLRTIFPFGASYDSGQSTGLLVTPSIDDTNNCQVLCEIVEHWFYGLALDNCVERSLKLTNQGASTIYYPDDPNSRKWWFSQTENDAVYTTNDDILDFMNVVTPGFFSFVFNGPAINEWIWATAALAFVDKYNEIVASFPSGSFD